MNLLMIYTHLDAFGQFVRSSHLKEENRIKLTRVNEERKCVMPQSLNHILKEYVKEICKIYGEQLQTVILYGSYARGDYRQDSDIDLMILVDSSDQEIEQKGRVLSDMTFEYNFAYHLEIMPIVKSQDHFKKWLRAYPFYHTIQKEGVKLYGV